MHPQSLSSFHPPELWTPATDQEIDGDPHLLVHASIGAPREVQEHNTHAPQRHTSPTHNDCKDQASTTGRSSASPYKPTPLLPMLATWLQRYELHCYLCMILLFLLQGSSTSASKCLLRYNHGSCTGSRGSTLLRVLAKDLAVQIKLCTTPIRQALFGAMISPNPKSVILTSRLEVTRNRQTGITNSKPCLFSCF